ncbi:MAG: dipeptidase [Clostridia bacterium]|nr:dipeptidase [Clostridia bacterium]
MKSFNIIDLHCDTIVECVTDGAVFRDGDGHISVEKLAAGGCLAQCFAIWIPTGRAIKRHKTARMGYYGYYKTAREFFQNAMAENADMIRQARTVADIEKNKADGKMSAILTVEDSIWVEGKMERIEEAAADGVRMMSLLWNTVNCMGYPNSPYHEAHLMGLKPFGYDAVRKMNDLGIIVDVSHLNEGGFWGVVKTSTKPVAASHSCARALCDHPRNLTDEQLKAIGECGGVVGINFYDEFLTPGDTGYTEISAITRHLEHIRDKAGIEALAFGSDFDGISSELEFEDYAGFPILLEAMEEVFSDDEIDMISHENFLRVMKDNE